MSSDFKPGDVVYFTGESEETATSRAGGMRRSSSIANMTLASFDWV